MAELSGATGAVVDRFAYVHVWLGSVPSKQAFWEYLEQDSLPEATFSAFMNDIGEAARYDDEFMIFGGCMCPESHPIEDLFEDTIVDESDRQALLDRCAALGVTMGNAFICYQDPDLNPPEKDYLGMRYIGQFKMQRIPKSRQY